MSVEMKVTLIGEDPEQQEAFNNAASAQPAPDVRDIDDREARRRTREEMTAALDDLLENPINTEPLEGSIEALALQIEELAKQEGTIARETRQRVRQEMADALDDMLKRPLEDATDKQERPEEVQPTGMGFDKLVDAFDQTLQKLISGTGLGSTRVGRTIGGLSSRAARGLRQAGAAVKSMGGGTTAAATTAAGTAGGAATAAGGAAAGSTATTAAAATIGTVAAPVVAVTAALAAGALTVKTFSDAVHKAASELEDLSPAIAIVRAQAQIRQEFARLDRAERIGAGAAQMEAARDRLQESMYAVQTSILEIMVKLGPHIEQILDMLNVGVRGVDAVIAQLEGVIATVNNIWGDTSDDAAAGRRMAQTMVDLGLAIQEALDLNAPPINQRDPFFDELLGGGIQNPQQPPRRQAPPLRGGAQP